MATDEQVLCVDTEYLNQALKGEEGFICDRSPAILDYVFKGLRINDAIKSFTYLEYPVICKGNYIGYVPRSECEESNKYKQIIPYGIITTDEGKNIKLLSYWRSSKSGEARLHNRCSIGVGGHINLEDYKKSKGVLPFAVTECLYREMNEELNGFDEDDYNYEQLGIINDNSSDVNQKHLGIVYHVKTNKHSFSVKEDSMKRIELLPLLENDWNYDAMEVWSQLVYRKLTTKLLNR